MFLGERYQIEYTFSDMFLGEMIPASTSAQKQ